MPRPRRSRRKLRWSNLHTLLVLAVILVVGTLLTFLSTDVSASRQAIPDRLTTPQIVIPLSIPEHDTGAGADEAAQLATLPEEDWLDIRVRRGDSMAAIFNRHNIPSQELHAIMRLGRITASLSSLHPDQVIRLRLNQDNQVLQLEYDFSPLQSLQVTRQDELQFAARLVQHELDAHVAQASGVISSSLFEAGKNAGLSDALIMEMAAIFGWDIDFVMDIREGDHFTLLYEEQYLHGQKISEGPILAAEFVNQGNRFHAIRYTDEEGRSDYYTPEGYSMRKAFLRNPVDFHRISSRFGNRNHPVRNQMRMHRGVDYAARPGTPIRAAGEGRIIHLGTKGGYGNTIIIQHGGQYTTLYAHMSGYQRGMRVGTRVRQGQIIGFVGSSGLATGPHLHYEFRVNGVHRNPLTIKLPNAEPIKASYKVDFEHYAQTLLAQLDALRPEQLALNQPD